MDCRIQWEGDTDGRTVQYGGKLGFKRAEDSGKVYLVREMRLILSFKCIVFVTDNLPLLIMVSVGM